MVVVAIATTRPRVATSGKIGAYVCGLIGRYGNGFSGSNAESTFCLAFLVFGFSPEEKEEDAEDADSESSESLSVKKLSTPWGSVGRAAGGGFGRRGTPLTTTFGVG